MYNAPLCNILSFDISVFQTSGKAEQLKGQNKRNYAFQITIVSSTLFAFQGVVEGQLVVDL